MEATKGFIPRPPTGKRPEHLPKNRPGCRYVKRNNTNEKPSRIDGTEKQHTNASISGTQLNSEGTKTVTSCAREARAEELTQPRPISMVNSRDLFSTSFY